MFFCYLQTTGPQPLWNPNYLQEQNRDNHITDLEHPSDIPNQHVNPDIHRKINNMDRDYKNKNNNIGEHKSQATIHTLDINSTVMQKKSNTPDPHPHPPQRPLTETKSILSGDEIVVGRISRPESAKSKRDTLSSAGKSRPNSAKPAKAPVNTSSISAYLQLKRAGKLNLNENVKFGATSSGMCKNKFVNSAKGYEVI